MHAFWGMRQVMLRRVNPRIREVHDLEFLEVLLLETIGTTDLSPSEISEAMQIPAHAISRKLDELEKAGLIERALDPKDARRRVLSLTSRGGVVMRDALLTLDAEVNRMLEVLTPEVRETMIDAIETMSQQMNSAQNSPQELL